MLHYSQYDLNTINVIKWKYIFKLNYVCKVTQWNIYLYNINLHQELSFKR